MSVKKMLLLASMAVAAVAFAAPAGASASGMFTHEHAEITETITTNLSGTIGFKGEAGSYECAASPVASIGTETGTITSLGLNTADCKGSGIFAHCKLKTHELTSGATLTPTGGDEPDIDLNNFKLTNVFETGSPGTEETTSTTACSLAGLPLELTFENGITLTPDDHTEINTLTPSGNGVLEIEPKTVVAAITAFGTLNVAENQEGTIGIST